jgi:pimeloyl-ACP methyl ester carboxylesterase
MTAASVLAEPPHRFLVEYEDGAVAGWRWKRDGAPTLVFVHATGFCASAYKPLLELLALRFNVWAVDLRGHGRTSLPADPARLRDWSVYGKDLRRLVESIDNSGPVLLAGHSCGAVVCALVAAQRCGVQGLAMIEPVATRPSTRLVARTPIWRFFARYAPLVRSARQRRAHWPDLETVREVYPRKRLFQSWAPGALAGYLEDGLTKTETGFALSCSPDWEAATFAAQGHDFWGAVARARTRVFVLAARAPSSTLFGDAERRFQRLGARVTRLEEASHMLPMENPVAAARFILACAPEAA